MGFEFLVNLCLYVLAGCVCVCLVNEDSDKEILPLMVILKHMNYLLTNGVGIPGESLFAYYSWVRVSRAQGK